MDSIDFRHRVLTKEELKERADLYRDDHDQKEYGDFEELLVFTMDGKLFGTSLYILKEVLKIQEINPLSKIDPVLKGFISLRGEIFMTMDLATVLELDGNYDPQKILVVEYEEAITGFLIEEIIGVEKVDKRNVQKGVEGVTNISSLFIKGIFNNGEEPLVWLNMKAITKECERKLE